MTANDPDSPEAWAEIKAKELRLWVTPQATGLWCSTCLLPSGYTLAVSRDPAEPSDSSIWGCVEDKSHRLTGELS